MKVYQDKNVYEASIERIKYCFDNFDDITVSFSGGKDSGVLLNLTLQYMRQYKIKQKIKVLFLDLEGMYTETVDYVQRMIENNDDLIEAYWFCYPVWEYNSSSDFEPEWQPWDTDKKNLWVRDMPDMPYVKNIDNFKPDFLQKIIDDHKGSEDFFTQWARYNNQKINSDVSENKNKKSVNLVGIRSDESLRRYVAVSNNKNSYNGINWTTRTHKNTYNAYPIYDWKVSDIWLANSKFNWDYNKIYDLFYMAGLSPDQMRICEPFGFEQKVGLSLYQKIEPNLWSKLVLRVSGANTGSMYSKTSMMGYRNIKLPEGRTWKNYVKFLLTTLPENTRANYTHIFRKYMRGWMKKGFACDQKTIDDLVNKGYEIEVMGVSTRSKMPKWDVRFKKIYDDLDIKYTGDMFCWKQMAVCILKGDYAGSTLDYSLTKEQIARQKEIIARYKNL